MIRVRFPLVSGALLGPPAPLSACLCPTIEECLASGALLLERAGIETARLDAECLLAHVLGCPRWRLVMEPRRRLTQDEFGRYLMLIQRREVREPLAYLLGRREFWSLGFEVSPGVLIPRPETETLVEAALAGIRQGHLASPVIVELCTGTGAVAIALARELPGATVFATDISRRALRVARANAETHGVADRIRLLRGDLWEALQGREPVDGVDLVVANPPYLPSGILPTLMPEVQWEPRRALDGGPDGLRFHQEIIAGAPLNLRPGGFLLLETGADQGRTVSGLVQASGGFEAPRVLQDLGGRDRVVVARRRGN
jgi:release factor glutamine methyltransferase